MNTMVTLEYVPCNLCGGDDLQTLYVGSDRRFDLPGAFPIVQCQRCGLIYLNPRPVSDALRRFYPAGQYYAYRPVTRRNNVVQRFRGGLKYLILAEHKGYPIPTGYQGRTGRMLVKILGTVLSSRFEGLPAYVAGGKILDVGCGNGNYLYSLRELGWETYGVEIDEQACHYAREVLGLTIFQGTLEEAHLPHNFLDVITMRHVLEHLPDPGRSLAEVYRLLRAGGSVLLETPNIESLQARFFKARWFHLDIPRHLYHFAPATLQALLQKAGFSGIQLSFLPSMTGITGSLQYWWNEWAGTRGTGVHRSRVLAWCLWPVGLLAARCGYGECLRAEAVKR